MKKNLHILFLFILLSACNYEPIFSSKDSKFSIVGIEIKNKNNLTYQITRSLKTYQNSDGIKKYKLEIEAEKKKEVTAKDSKGNIKSYKIVITCNFIIYEKDEIINSKTITESFGFNNNSDKFKLRKYESNIEKDLVNKIIEDLVLELY
ncbi:hypothetical protein N9K55_03805, partial [Candidatus Pelagibacter bacterium]|nr:hypothetical protein [Candidatus Pelagibacter bacterium]